MFYYTLLLNYYNYNFLNSLRHISGAYLDLKTLKIIHLKYKGNLDRYWRLLKDSNNSYKE